MLPTDGNGDGYFSCVRPLVLSTVVLRRSMHDDAGEPAGRTRGRTHVRARQLACDLPAVHQAHTVGRVVAALSVEGRPGVLVVGPAGAVLGALSVWDLLDLLVPGPVRESPLLSLAYDERHADQTVAILGSRRLQDALPDPPAPAPLVPGHATVVEIATVMSRTRCPFALVTEGGRLTGAVTASRLLETVAVSADAGTA
jgi:CBS domain-containing protein